MGSQGKKQPWHPRSSRKHNAKKVYVLKRGNSPDTTSQDIHNRDLWRVGTVTAAANGRFTVQYNAEEGKPKESRIVAARIRTRNVIRQKAVQKVAILVLRSRCPPVQHLFLRFLWCATMTDQNTVHNL